MKQPRRTGNTQIDRALRDVSEELEPLTTVPIVSGVLLKSVTIADGATVDVPHGLRRNFRGWFVADITGAYSTTGRIVRQAHEDEERFLRLKADGWGATVTVALWVF